MATEIERKYLIKSLPSGLIEESKANHILQGYIAVHSDKTEVRIRRFAGEYWQTIKSPGHLSRLEFELPIEKDLFSDLWPLTEGRNLEKSRYEIPYQGKAIEVDIYNGKLTGLIVAEVEFESMEECQNFNPPDWFDSEISGERQYKNFILASEGLPQ